MDHRRRRLAVIAHPARYKLTANEEYALFTEFKAHGGRGVEVVTGSHTAAEYVKYADTAREFGLGRLARQRLPQPRREPHRPGPPALPARGTHPVWELLADRIQ